MKRILGISAAMVLSLVLACGALAVGFYHLEIARAEEALATFDGTVIFVSHDRRFLENVATRIAAWSASASATASTGSRRRSFSSPPPRSAIATSATASCPTRRLT